MPTPISPEKDPVKLAPETYRVLLENDRVRVLEIRLEAGGKSPMHSHPPYVAYALSRFKIKLTTPDGQSRQMVFWDGETGWSEAETHAVENLGDTELHALNIELKGP